MSPDSPRLARHRGAGYPEERVSLPLSGAARYRQHVLDFARRLGRSVWFRAAVSLGLLALVVSQIDLAEAADRLSSGRWGLFVAAIAVLFASFVVGALRWHIYLTAAQVARDVSSSVRAYLIGVFTNNFLPSQVGGDVARAWVATAPGTRLRGAATVVFDRVTALACLIVVGWIAYATNADAVPWELVIALAASTAAVAVGTAAAAARPSRRPCQAPRAREAARRRTGGARSVACMCAGARARADVRDRPRLPGSRRPRKLARRPVARARPPLLHARGHARAGAHRLGASHLDRRLRRAGGKLRRSAVVRRHQLRRTRRCSRCSRAQPSRSPASPAGWRSCGLPQRSARPAQTQDREQERREEHLDARR